MKHIIINADDFGHSMIFNDVILDLIEKECISSTSVMMTRMTAKQDNQIKNLIELGKLHHASIGLHVEFETTAFAQEIEKQFNAFVSLFKFKPSHLDIHKSTYVKDASPYLHAFCEKNHLPCRNLKKYGVPYSKAIMTDETAFEGTWKTFEQLKEWIETLKDNRSYELAFHPGKYDPENTSTLNKDREKDAENAIKLKPLLPKHHIKLINYYDLVKIHQVSKP